MQSMCSFSATTASIHLLFGANTIRTYAYFRVVQLTELNSEVWGPPEKKVLYLFFFTPVFIISSQNGSERDGNEWILVSKNGSELTTIMG